MRCLRQIVSAWGPASMFFDCSTAPVVGTYGGVCSQGTCQQNIRVGVKEDKLLFCYLQENSSKVVFLASLVPLFFQDVICEGLFI